jgi:hypothetical protein
VDGEVGRGGGEGGEGLERRVIPMGCLGVVIDIVNFALGIRALFPSRGQDNASGDWLLL